MDKVTQYSHRYRNVSYIVKYNEWYKQDNPWWTYYIDILLKRLPERVDPSSFWLKINDRGFYNYYEHPILNEVYFYGGITFYEKLGIDGDRRIRIGCDYNHSWDYYDEVCRTIKGYSLEDIQNDVKKTIDSFLEIIPEYENEEK